MFGETLNKPGFRALQPLKRHLTKTDNASRTQLRHDILTPAVPLWTRATASPTRALLEDTRTLIWRFVKVGPTPAGVQTVARHRQ